MGARAVRHHCGLFGVFGHPDAAAVTHLGLFALQHRGQESAGICTTDGREIRRKAGVGLVNHVFDVGDLDWLRNPIAIGHVRYATTGSSTEANAQPLLFRCAQAPVAIAHNGNLVNAVSVRREIEATRGGTDGEGVFRTTGDTEVIGHLLAEAAKPGGDADRGGDLLEGVLESLRGAYALLLLHADRIEAVRDPLGFRPLSLGRLANGAWVVASETCALDVVDARFERDVLPGEIVTISALGLSSRRFGARIADERGGRGAACVFEHVYFADPSSNVFGDNVHVVRTRMGRKLAEEAPVEADLVVPVPNCARCAAIGYSRQSGIALGRAFTTSHFTGRSFLMPDQASRDQEVRMKLRVIRDAVRGKRLVVVEDSVVRGTTTRGKMGALRRAGAAEIHLRVASAPIRHPCFFGIDFPDPAKLVATGRTVEEVRSYLGVDSLMYLSMEGMLSCLEMGADHYCAACFDGQYPVGVTEPVDKFAMERPV